MYLIGSKTFYPIDEDWACNVDFELKEKYFELKPSSSKNWEDVLCFSETIIANYVKSKKFIESIFSNVQGITTGFDSGNLTIIYAQIN